MPGRVPGSDGYFRPDVFRNGRFCGYVRRRRPRRPEKVHKRPGSDLRYDLDITLEEAAKGCTKKLEIERLVTCKTCHGTGARDGKEAFKSCPTCQGRGIITQQSGFFVQQSTCPTCHGTGEIISDPCPVCRGEGRVREDSHITIRIPGGVATAASSASPGKGMPGCMAAYRGSARVY